MLLAATRELCRRRSVILGYHGVGSSPPAQDPHNHRIPAPVFRTQVELLRDAGYRFVTVAELAERAAGGPPPAGLAALSFDDGMEDNHSIVLPMLTEYGIPATAYVITGLIGRDNPWVPGTRMMTETQLRELLAGGFEIGAHTVTHPDLSRLDQAQCLREMVESRGALEDLTAQPVRTFAYPECRYGQAALAGAAAAGFSAAVTCEGRGSWRPLEMKRALITARDGPVAFFLKLTDRYQGLFDSAAGRTLRWGTRAPRRLLARPPRRG